MGYCIYQGEVKFTIKVENKVAALQAVKGLAGKETIKYRDGRSNFSWVNTEEFVNVPILEKALEAWRWHPIVDKAGNITCLEFKGEKYGDDTLLFTALAPYVEAGSYIKMKGEDGALFRWVFDGKGVKEQQATVEVVWPEE